MVMKRLSILVLAAAAMMTGCGGQSSQNRKRFEPFGKVYYLDGAGNLGFGQDTVPKGLRSGGFGGDVENIIWTSFTGPFGDQIIRANARAKARDFARKIVKYRKQYPDAPLYIIGLSAGTGVATWAVQDLPKEVSVDNMVLLGSSLSNNYDMTKCLEHVAGKVYVFHSPRDAVLSGFIPVTGTIDGSYLVQPAGLIGMKLPPKASSHTRDLYTAKIQNLPWRPAFRRLGYAGGHTDATRFQFIKQYIAKKLLNTGGDTSQDEAASKD